MGTTNNENTKRKPGWYDDPQSDDLLCYWDGQKFTDEFQAKYVYAANKRAPGFKSLVLVGFILTLVALVPCLIPYAALVGVPVSITGLIIGLVGKSYIGKAWTTWTTATVTLGCIGIVGGLFIMFPITFVKMTFNH